MQQRTAVIPLQVKDPEVFAWAGFWWERNLGRMLQRSDRRLAVLRELLKPPSVTRFRDLLWPCT